MQWTVGYAIIHAPRMRVGHACVPQQSDPQLPNAFSCKWILDSGAAMLVAAFWAATAAAAAAAGVLFVTIPAFQVGGNAFTQSWQNGVNKSVGIK